MEDAVIVLNTGGGGGGDPPGLGGARVGNLLFGFSSKLLVF